MITQNIKHIIEVGIRFGDSLLDIWADLKMLDTSITYVETLQEFTRQSEIIKKEMNK